MLSDMFQHCILARYSDVINANCFDSFQSAMMVINEYNRQEYYPNHIRYCHVWKWWPDVVKKEIFNHQFNVPIKNVHSHL